MKKKSKKRRIREMRLTVSRNSLNLGRKEHAKNRRRALSGYVAPVDLPERRRERLRLTAPSQIDLYSSDNHRRIARFLRKLRTVTLKGGHRVVIDFSNTTRVTAAAMLLTLAEIERIYELHPRRRPVIARMPREDVVRQVFQQIGLCQLLGIKRSVPVTHENVTFWRYVSGTKVNGEAVGQVLENFQDQMPENSELYDGVSEAMTNAVQHAGIAKRSDGIPILDRRWWMFAGVRRGELAVVVADLGIGIPRSVPVNWGDEAIGRLLEKIGLRRTTDGNYIRLAMELRRTRTNLRHRGKGMPELKDVLDQAGDGVLSVYSNKGGYTYSPTMRTDGKIRSFKMSIMGTIIEWSLPLADAKELTI